jgi:hypothetical protein
VLPPWLPHAVDYDPSHEKALITLVLETLEELKRSLRDEHMEILQCAINTVNNLSNCRTKDGCVIRDSLESALANLVKIPTDAFVALQVKEQNAGILIS